MPRMLPIHLHQQHRTGGDEALAAVEAANPGVVGETVRAAYVNAPESERHRVHAGRRAGRGTQAEPAVEKGVVILEAVVEPAAFGEPVLVAFDTHVLRRRLAES